MTTTDLAGKTALVTGATSGIGEATAKALAQRGAHVLVVGRDTGRGRTVVEAIRATGGQADALTATLHDAESARTLARRAVEVTGQVDILVNNAGGGPVGPTSTVEESSFDDTFAVNVKVPLFLVAELAPAMAERGSGAIINVGTMAAEIGMAGMALYGASKAALNLLTKAWAAEFGPSGVRVNGVNPGPTRTPGTAPLGPMLDQIAAQAPAGRTADPAEIASAIAFLASDAASFIHGTVVAVDGGRLAA
jgi:NAD(P)-dependent dehydrogenase (short-subunit alcohol dehydrogenase family)